MGAAMASCWHETKGMAGQLCPPTKLKYLAVTVMTAASTVLAKSVRFLEHVSPGCCAGIASIVPVNLSIIFKLLVSPVSFSHNNVRLLMVYSPYGKFAYRATCRLQNLTGQTDRQNCQLQ